MNHSSCLSILILWMHFLFLSLSTMTGAWILSGPQKDGFAAESTSTLTLTLEQSISIAIKNATTVLKAQNNTKLNSVQLLQSYAEFLPNLQVGGSYSYNSGKTLYAITGLTIVNSHYLGANYQISSTLNLFNGLADLGSLKAALNNKKASELSLEFAKQQITLDVTQSFLQVILDQQIVTIAEKNLTASQARLRLLQAQTSVGTTSIADLYRQEAQTSADQIYLTQAKTKDHDDQLLLVQKLRLNPLDHYVLYEPPLASTPPSMTRQSEKKLIEIALHQRKDYQALNSHFEASRWNITTARAGYLPRLDLSFNRLANGRYLQTQWVNGVNLLPPQQSSLGSQLGNIVSYTFSINLTWNIFDRFLTRVNVEQAQITSDNLELDYEDLRLQIISQVKQAKADYITAFQQVQTAHIAVEAAQKAYATIEGQYQVGSASFIDVLSSQSALVQARANRAQAIINLKLQEKILEYTVGQIPTLPLSSSNAKNSPDHLPHRDLEYSHRLAYSSLHLKFG